MFTKTLAALACAALATATAAAEPRKIDGLATPESVLVSADGRIVVSEIVGFGQDGDGRVSVVDAEGKAKPLASGLDDPKGLAERAGVLYVADKTRVVRIDKGGRASVFADTAAFPQPPLFLNDLAFDAAGNLYVSDTGDIQAGGKGAIFRITPAGKVTAVITEAQNPAIKSPNGLLADGPDRLLVLDFATGQLLRLHLKTKAVEKLAEGFGGGDGIARDAAGLLYLSDWKGGKVWKLDARKPGASPQPYGQAFQAAADIAFSTDGKFVLLPDMKAGTLHWMRK